MFLSLKCIIQLLADISNRECEATATEIEEDAAFKYDGETSLTYVKWSVKDCHKVHVLTQFYLGRAKGDWCCWNVREKGNWYNNLPSSALLFLFSLLPCSDVK